MERLVPGFVLADRYRLGELVATGGMGAVWSARDLVLERTVALKVLLPHIGEQPMWAERFREEARLAARLKHPNLVSVYDFGQSGGLPFLVMEFVAGPTLSALLETEGVLPAARVRSLLVQLAAALEAAHQAGIVHRDVKPANVLVASGGLAKLTDFGVARRLGGNALTLAGEVLGTTHYLSPEQALGEPVTHRSDLYGLGVLAHELLTGRKPFDKATPIATALAHVQEPPPPLPPDAPADLVRIIAACLEKDPELRPPSAAAVGRSLGVRPPA